MTASMPRKREERVNGNVSGKKDWLLDQVNLLHSSKPEVAPFSQLRDPRYELVAQTCKVHSHEKRGSFPQKCEGRC